MVGIPDHHKQEMGQAKMTKKTTKPEWWPLPPFPPITDKRLYKQTKETPTERRIREGNAEINQRLEKQWMPKPAEWVNQPQREKPEKEAIIVNSNELILDVLVAARNIIFHPRYWTKYTDARKFVPSLTVYNPLMQSPFDFICLAIQLTRKPECLRLWVPLTG